MTAPLNDQFLKSLFPDLDQFLITFAKRIPIHSCRPANVPYTSANDTTIHKDLINDKKNTIISYLYKYTCKQTLLRRKIPHYTGSYSAENIRYRI